MLKILASGRGTVSRRANSNAGRSIKRLLKTGVIVSERDVIVASGGHNRRTGVTTHYFIIRK